MTTGVRKPRMLAFGIEIELCLSPKDTDFTKGLLARANWDPSSSAPDYEHRHKLRQVVQYAMENEELACTTERPTAYDRWLIDEDASLFQDECDGYWSVEIVSPILHTDDLWQQLLVVAYESVKKAFHIKATKSCGTHVHVSPRSRNSPDAQWTASNLQSILKAAAVFDQSIVAMLPPDRKGNTYAVSNFSYPSVPRELRYPHYDAVTTGDFGPVFDIIDSFHTPSDFARFYGGSRYYSFNFSHLLDTTVSCGTIEFRSPPPAAEPRLVVHWVGWTLSFMAAALEANWSTRSARTRGQSTADEQFNKLIGFLLRGYATLPRPSHHSLHIPFLQKHDGELIVYSEEETAEIDRIKALKNKKAAHFSTG